MCIIINRFPFEKRVKDLVQRLFVSVLTKGKTFDPLLIIKKFNGILRLSLMNKSLKRLTGKIPVNQVVLLCIYQRGQYK